MSGLKNAGDFAEEVKGLHDTMAGMAEEVERMEKEAEVLQKLREFRDQKEEAYTAALIRCALIEAAGKIVRECILEDGLDEGDSEVYCNAREFLVAEFGAATKKEKP